MTEQTEPFNSFQDASLRRSIKAGWKGVLLSIPSRMLQRYLRYRAVHPYLVTFNSFQDASTQTQTVTDQEAFFQFLLGCFSPFKCPRLKVGDEVFQFLLGCFTASSFLQRHTCILSIPSRMLPSTLLPKGLQWIFHFQFLLGCFTWLPNKHRTSALHFFQFLLGCFCQYLLELQCVLSFNSFQDASS